MSALSPPAPANKSPLGPAVRYNREFTSHDFVGKYHISRIENETPIPGTQIKLERIRKEEKEKDVKRFEDELEKNALQRVRNMHIKKIGTEFKTRVMMDTVLGGPVNAIQTNIQEKDAIIYKKEIYPDPIKNILRFNKNMKLGRSHYVSFAITTGFQSINWADEEFGNTSLHSAVQVSVFLSYNTGHI